MTRKLQQFKMLMSKYSLTINDDDVDAQVVFLFYSNQTNQIVMLKLPGQQTVINQWWAVFLVTVLTEFSGTSSHPSVVQTGLATLCLNSTWIANDLRWTSLFSFSVLSSSRIDWFERLWLLQGYRMIFTSRRHKPNRVMHSPYVLVL